MAISITTPNSNKFGFILNATSADISGCETLKDAPSAPLAIVLDHITINSTGAVTVTIGQGKNGAAVTTALIGPISFSANTSLQWDFPQGMVLSAATALTCDASAGGNICIFAYGRIQ